MLSKHLLKLAALISGLTLTGAVLATPITMNFDTITTGSAGTGQYVHEYYNGGCTAQFFGGGTTCAGPNDGVVWVDAVAVRATDSNIDAIGEPSPPNVILPYGGAMTMTASSGFSSLAFAYASANLVNTVTVYSGPDGTGTPLAATETLPATGTACNGSTAPYSCWDSFTATFSGIAQSAVFRQLFSPGNIYFDDVTLGAPLTSVPEPGSLAMLGLGLLALGFFVFRSRRRHA